MGAYLHIRVHDKQREFNMNYYYDSYDTAKSLADIIRYISFYFNLICEIQVVESDE